MPLVAEEDMQKPSKPKNENGGRAEASEENQQTCLVGRAETGVAGDVQKPLAKPKNENGGQAEASKEEQTWRAKGRTSKSLHGPMGVVIMAMVTTSLMVGWKWMAQRRAERRLVVEFGVRVDVERRKETKEHTRGTREEQAQWEKRIKQVKHTSTKKNLLDGSITADQDEHAGGQAGVRAAMSSDDSNNSNDRACVCASTTAFLLRLSREWGVQK